MSATIIVEEIRASLQVKQKMNCRRTQHVKGVRLHLLRIGAPAGSVFVQFQDSNGNVLATSNSLTIAELGEGDHWLGFVPFTLNCGATKDLAYYIAIGVSGYSYSDSACIAWIKEWAFGSPRYESDYTVTSVEDAPLDVEMWENALVSKGTYP